MFSGAGMKYDLVMQPYVMAISGRKAWISTCISIDWVMDVHSLYLLNLPVLYQIFFYQSSIDQSSDVQSTIDPIYWGY